MIALLGRPCSGNPSAKITDVGVVPRELGAEKWRKSDGVSGLLRGVAGYFNERWRVGVLYPTKGK